MKKLLFIIMALFLFFACESDQSGESNNSPGGITEFSGRIEKGALQKGATISASEWSPTSGYSGKVFYTETLNNLGGYTISSSDLQGILDVRAIGFFINENTGTVSENTITLYGLVDSQSQGGNINIVTHIIKQRVINLMKNQGKTFSQANSQAVNELYNNLNWTPENPLNTNISTNAKLLFLSAAICKNRTVSQVSELLTTLTDDMSDGVVDLSILYTSFSLVDVEQVRANMISLYGTCPDISSVKNQVLSYLNLQDYTNKIITVQPVEEADFYIKTSSGLFGFINGEYKSINIKYTQQYLGVTETFNGVIDNFFKKDGKIYFKLIAGEDTYFCSQENGAITYLSSLPVKPVKNFTSLINLVDDLGYQYVTSLDNFYDNFGNPLTANNQRITIRDNSNNQVHAYTRSGHIEVWVVSYFLCDSFVYNTVQQGRGIFLVWSNGDTFYHRISSYDPVVLTSGEMW